MPRKRTEKASDRKRPNGLGSVLELPDGRWRWRVTVGYRAGKQVRASGIEADKTKALKAAAEAVTNHEKGIFALPDRVTVAEYAERWMGLRVDWARNTRARNERHLAYALKALHQKTPFGQMRVQAVKPGDIKALLAELAKREMKNGLGRGRPMSSSTLAGIRTLLRTIFKEALHDELISRNPAEGVKRVKPLKTEHPGIALDFEQAARFHEIGEALHVAGRARLWPALFACGAIGLRRGEVMALRWQDLDWTGGADGDGIVMVRQTLTVLNKVFELRGAKTETSERDVPMPSSLKAMLLGHQRAVLAQAAAVGREVKANEPVFATCEGKYTHPDNLNRALEVLIAWSDPTCKTKTTKQPKKRLEKQPVTLERRLVGIPCDHRPRLEAAILAGVAIPMISPHDLRHTAATQMIRRGMDILELASILGHADPSVTYKVYSHAIEARKRRNVIDLFETPPPVRTQVPIHIN